jgi:excisionase family DNA binding protein
MKKTSVLEIMTDIRNLMLMQKEIFTVEEAATYTGYEVSYLRKLCSQRQIPHYKTPGGKQTFFDRKELSEYLKSRRIKPRYEIDQEAERFLKSKSI